MIFSAINALGVADFLFLLGICLAETRTLAWKMWLITFHAAELISTVGSGVSKALAIMTLRNALLSAIESLPTNHEVVDVLVDMLEHVESQIFGLVEMDQVDRVLPVDQECDFDGRNVVLN